MDESCKRKKKETRGRLQHFCLTKEVLHTVVRHTKYINLSKLSELQKFKNFVILLMHEITSIF